MKVGVQSLPLMPTELCTLIPQVHWPMTFKWSVPLTVNQVRSRLRGLGIQVTTVGNDVRLSLTRIPLDSIELPRATTSGQIIKWDGTKWVIGEDLLQTYYAGAGIRIQNDTINNDGDRDPSDDVLTTTVAAGDVTGTFQQLRIAPKGASTGDILTWNGTEWVPAPVAAPDTASATQDGILTSIDWQRFDAKADAYTPGNVTSGTPSLSVANGTDATIGPDVELKLDTASAISDGLLTASDWISFEGKADAFTPGDFTSTSPALNVTGGSNITVGPNASISIDTASATSDGILLASDWTTFNNKMDSFTAGNLTSTTPALSVANGSGSTAGPDASISIDTASTTSDGILLASDWQTFNNKMDAFNAGDLTSATPALSVSNGSASTAGPNVSVSIDTASSTSDGILLASDWTSFSNKMDSFTAGHLTSLNGCANGNQWRIVNRWSRR